MAYITLSTALVVITVLLVIEKDSPKEKKSSVTSMVQVGTFPGILVAVLHIFFTVTFRDGFHFWSTLGYLFLVAVYGLLVIFSFNTGTKPEPVSGPVSEEVDEFAAATAMPMPNPKVAKQNPKELV